jgi:uncharacterized membrane protein YoaK (UPF0700 family)
MRTESPTTTLASVDSQGSHARMRNWLLAGLTLSSGAVDAISFLGLGKVFTAFMTGNIAFLGMRVAGSAVAPRISLLLASMVGYAVGIYLATRIVRRGQPTTLAWPRATTVALTVSLVPHFVFALIWFATGGRPDDTVIPILLGAWAMAMGMQSGAVRRLNVGGVFTTAATATFIFLVGDWANRNSLTSDEHSRLRGVLVSLAVGATIGGWLLLHAPAYAPLFPFVVTALVVAAAARAFRHGDQPPTEAAASEGRSEIEPREVLR